LKAFVPLLALAVAVAALAAAASASNLTDVRVGVHGDHTRIVLETDGKAPYIVDAGEKEIIVHIDAAATAEAVTAKSPHLIWVKVEPTQIGADVRLQLKQPADVKALVLTGPDRIVLDLYPRKAAAAPLPAPTLVPEEAPAPTAEAEPAIPLEPQEMEAPAPPEQAAPGSEELAANAELEQAAAQAEAETPMAVGEEPAAEAPGAEPTAAPEAPSEDVAQAPVAMDEAPQSPVTPAAPAPSGNPFGSPYVLAVAAVALLVLSVVLHRRLRSAEKAPRPARRDEPAAPFEPAQRAVPVGTPSASGESLFDVESEAIGPLPKDEEAVQGLRRAGVEADAGDDRERRMAHLERRIEELVDARERLERQVAAQTEELRVQRAAIARTQRVLRTVAPRTDEEGSSGEPLKG
jgi:hypothetical protein